MEMFDALIEALQLAREKAAAEHGSVIPTLVMWGVAFVLLATGWTI